MGAGERDPALRRRPRAPGHGWARALAAWPGPSGGVFPPAEAVPVRSGLFPALSLLPTPLLDLGSRVRRPTRAGTGLGRRRSLDGRSTPAGPLALEGPTSDD